MLPASRGAAAPRAPRHAAGPTLQRGRGACGRRMVAARAAAAAVGSPLRPTMGNQSLEALQAEREFCSVFRKYSPEDLQARALAGGLPAVLRVGGRIANIVIRFGLFFGGILTDNVTGAADTPERVKMRAAQLRETLTALGPSFIKAGQVLANRPDILRQDYMNELCVLQDDVPPFPDAEAFAILEAQLGRPLDAVFSAITPSPIAAASLGQVYKATLLDGGAEVAVKVQRPGIEPTIVRDLFIFRALAWAFDTLAMRRLGCAAALVVDEFGEKLMEELDYTQEARNIEDFGRNFENDPSVKIPWVRRDLCSPKVIVMEWISGVRCTDPDAIRASGISVDAFIRCGVVSGLRQLLEFGLFHGDPHPGNIFALPDGRIAYVDFGNVAQLSQRNKQILIDAVVHAVNEDYASMSGDFIKLGFLAPGVDTAPIIPALEKIWRDSKGQSMADFNFRTVTSRFNELVYQYPVRIPERFSLVIRSLLTQEGICMTLKPEFHFLEVAYPYIARRLLTDEDPALRERLFQVLFQDGKFQWQRLENLIGLAKEGASGRKAAASAGPGFAAGAPAAGGPGGLDLSDTVKDALRVMLVDERLRAQVLLALTEDNTLHVAEVAKVLSLVQADIDPRRLAGDVVRGLPQLSRQLMLNWADKVLVS